MCGRVPGPLDVCSGLCSGGGMGARQKELWKVWRRDWRLSVLRRAPATRSDPTRLSGLRLMAQRAGEQKQPAQEKSAFSD